MIVLQILYMISAMGLALVGFNTLALVILYLVHRHERTASISADTITDWPSVVVQLPIYNERHVVERLIEAASQLDYPRDRLTIQVLDDSTDDTTSRAASAVERARASGLHIEHIRRSSRNGFKAGALAHGLKQTDADLVAIFDADFVPGPDFLRQVVPYFLANDRLGMVQVRWAHLNADYSLLTRAQALALDAHFVIEQTARHRSGLLMNFSGTAGIWRRACIETSGGWHCDTLSEDIDLSYRAQLAGWQFLYLPDLAVPAEIPPLMMAFKRQQARWATGTVQCLRKLGGTLLRARLTVWQKFEGFLHLGGYFLHPLMLLLLLLSLPLMLTDHLNGLPLAGLGLAMFGPPLQTIIAQRVLYPGWRRRLACYPVFMLLGVGIAVNNTVAVLKALSSRPQPFQRTPKFHVQEHGREWAHSTYTLPIDLTTWVELFFGLYALATAILAVPRLPGLVPFMTLYALGFALVAGLSIRQARQGQRAHTARRMFSLSGTAPAERI